MRDFALMLLAVTAWFFYLDWSQSNQYQQQRQAVIDQCPPTQSKADCLAVASKLADEKKAAAVAADAASKAAREQASAEADKARHQAAAQFLNIREEDVGMIDKALQIGLVATFFVVLLAVLGTAIRRNRY